MTVQKGRKQPQSPSKKPRESTLSGYMESVLAVTGADFTVVCDSENVTVVSVNVVDVFCVDETSTSDTLDPYFSFVADMSLIASKGMRNWLQNKMKFIQGPND